MSTGMLVMGKTKVPKVTARDIPILRDILQGQGLEVASDSDSSLLVLLDGGVRAMIKVINGRFCSTHKIPNIQYELVGNGIWHCALVI